MVIYDANAGVGGTWYSNRYPVGLLSSFFLLFKGKISELLIRAWPVTSQLLV